MIGCIKWINEYNRKWVWLDKYVCKSLYSNTIVLQVNKIHIWLAIESRNVLSLYHPNSIYPILGFTIKD